MLSTLSEVNTDTRLVGGSCDAVVKVVNIRVDTCKISLDVYDVSRVLSYVRFEAINSSILLIVLSLYEIKSVLSSVNVILSSCHPAIEGSDVVLCCVHSAFETRDLGVVTIEPVLYGNHLTLERCGSGLQAVDLCFCNRDPVFYIIKILADHACSVLQSIYIIGVLCNTSRHCLDVGSVGVDHLTGFCVVDVKRIVVVNEFIDEVLTHYSTPLSLILRM